MVSQLHAADLEPILDAYGLAGSRLEPLESAANVVFRVESPRGARFALRIQEAPQPDAIRAHVPFVFGWLEQILATRQLRVPRPVRLASGDLCGEIQTASGVGVHVLFEWIDGEHASSSRDPEVARGMGSAIAELHESSRAFAPPREQCAIRWDQESLLGPGSWMARGQAEDDLGAQAWRLVSRAGRKMALVLDSLGRESHRYGLIHSDTHPANMLLSNGEIAVLDFCDCGFGHYGFDLGAMLHELMDEPETCPERSAAVLAGYEAVCPLPVAQRDQLQAFMALRALASLQWIARSPDPEQRRTALLTGPWVPLMLEQLDGYVSSGAMKLVCFR